MTELKKIDFTEKKFTANGKEYIIEQSMSYQRWKWWRKIQVELPYDMNFDTLFSKLKEAWNYLNKPQPQPMDAGVILYNVMHGLSNAMNDKHIPLVVQMCALFMNTKDEDRRIITTEMIETKSADWEKEGIDMNSFFMFAISSIPNFLTNYSDIIRGISEKEARLKETAESLKQ